jgi:hypothetical protein
VHLRGKKLEIWRELVIFARLITGIQLLNSLVAYQGVFRQIRNRSLSDQANGVETVIRPDELLIQSESITSAIIWILTLILLNETWALFRTTNQFLPPALKRVP